MRLAALVFASLLASVPAEARPWQSERVTASDAVNDAAIAERAARTYLAAHLPTGATLADFSVVANQLDGGLRTIAFQQTWRGLRVVDATVAIVFGHSPGGDRLFAVRSDVAGVSPPVVARHRDLARSETWIASETRRRVHARATGELVVLDNQIVELVDVEAIDTPERWTVYAGADGTPLRRDRLVMDYTATIKLNAGTRYAMGTRQDYDAEKANVTINAASSMTSATGTITWTGTNPATVVPSLTGAYVRINNAAGPVATTTFAGVQPGSTQIWNLSQDELGDAQVSTYVYANRAKARARIVNPSLATWLDTPLDFYVNEMGDCNAYSTGNEVHLDRATPACENTGRLADVVFHEFGHSVHKHSVINGAGAFESQLSEGLADFFAANITEDPAVGRGFYLDDAPLRNIDPIGLERTYPADMDYDAHISGLIISGALWDLRKALVEQFGYTAGVALAEKIFTGVMQRADTIGNSFGAALLADDDNSDLSDGTPHYCAIETAFGRHGLVPNYVTTSVGLPVVDGLHVSLGITMPSGTTCAPPVVTHASVIWKVDDGVASVFELTQDGDTWSGDIPDQPRGTVVAYTVEVQFNDGTSEVFPNNPADPMYQLMVGVPSQIWCERMDSDPGWDQSNNVGTEWQWAPPVATMNSGDPAVARTGSNILGTDITGDGHYHSDLVSSIATPATNVSRYEHVHLQYWRWLTVEDARYDQASILANGQIAWHNAQTPGGTLDHVDREWRFHDVDVSGLVQDGSVQITWTLTSDFDKELGGWNLDDVCLVGLDHIGTCGDMIVELGEQCDDGDTKDGDGCDHRCLLEPTAGGGGCATGGGYGWLVAVLSVVLPWRRRSRPAPSRSVSERMP